MRLLSLVAVATAGFCINAAGPVRAKDGVTQLQEQWPYTHSGIYQMAESSIWKTIVAPVQTELNIGNRKCEERTKRWKKWYPICLKECEDIAASYTFYNSKSNNSPATVSMYQRELNSCIAACNSKNAYYLNNLC